MDQPEKDKLDAALARPAEAPQAPVLTIRAHCGLSGDMLLAGLATLLMKGQDLQPESAEAAKWLDEILGSVMPELRGTVRIGRVERFGIGGYAASVNLPHEHVHRHLEDIEKIIRSSDMLVDAGKLALACFELLAAAEGHVHGVPARDVHFHEVGALDSILDICAVCELYAMASCPSLVCSPLPMADGSISCAHGIIPAPAPVVLELLQGFEVMPFAGAPDSGELVTPTALALLRTLGASCSGWPAMWVENCVLAYGQKVFPAVPNGAIFAIGQPLPGIGRDVSISGEC